MAAVNLESRSEPIIAVEPIGYSDQRSILDVWGSTVRVESDFSLLPPVIARQMDYARPWLTNVVAPPPSGRLFHYFNAIPVTNVRFVTSFEASVPRWWGMDSDAWRLGYEILASDRCRRLIAISDYAQRLNKQVLERKADPRLRADIEDKLEVLHPPQSLPEANWNKFAAPRLRFAFIGRALLRKGGYDLLKVADSLRERYEFDVTIVSKMDGNLDAGPWNDDAERKLSEARDIIARRGFEYFTGLPSDGVMALFARSHVNVLPSFHDTYGYSVLEGQSALCPAITTDQRAFPEINSEDAGWLLPIEQDRIGQPSMDPTAFAHQTEQVRAGLTKVMEQILEAGAPALRAKAEACVDRIRREHDPANVRARLGEIYAASR